MPEKQFKKPEFPFTNDYVFNRVLSTYNDLAIELVRVVTGNVATIDQINQQQVINPTKSNKECRYDIYISTKQGDIYDIEMQNKNEYNISKRARYYISSNDVSIAKHAYNYNDLPVMYLIVICTFDPFKAGYQKYVVKERVFVKDKDVTDETTYELQYVKIFLNAGSVYKDGDIASDLSAFMGYIRNGEPSNNFTSELNDAVNEVNNTERNMIMTFEEELILRSMEDQKRGYNKGLQEGLKNGIEQKQQDIIKRMINLNYSLDEICNISGLSKEDVNQIINAVTSDKE